MKKLLLATCLCWGLFVGSAHAALSPYNRFDRVAHEHGIVMAIPGGGWAAADAAVVSNTAKFISDAFFRTRNWSTYTVGYRAGTDSLVDVQSAYDWLRRTYPRTPLCVWGDSAGGNLALLLAEHRAPLHCVIGEGAPTDLYSLQNELAYPINGDPHAGPQWLCRYYIRPLLGGSIWAFSPALHRDAMDANVLLGASSADWIVPQVQMAEMKAVAPRLVQTMLVPGNPDRSVPPNFTHAGVTAAGLARWRTAELAQLAKERRAEIARVYYRRRR